MTRSDSPFPSGHGKGATFTDVTADEHGTRAERRLAKRLAKGLKSGVPDEESIGELVDQLPVGEWVEAYGIRIKRSN